MQGTLISLTEEIASALAADFKIYLPKIVPHALKVFMLDNSPGKSFTLKVEMRYFEYFFVVNVSLCHLIKFIVFKHSDATCFASIWNKS